LARQQYRGLGQVQNDNHSNNDIDHHNNDKGRDRRSCMRALTSAAPTRRNAAAIEDHRPAGRVIYYRSRKYCEIANQPPTA
jgi:hypothetical protein